MDYATKLGLRVFGFCPAGSTSESGFDLESTLFGVG